MPRRLSSRTSSAAGSSSSRSSSRRWCGTPDAILWVWLLGGALAFAGAMAYAELSALRPRAGGEYVYLREAFGPARRIPYRVDVVCRRIFRRHRGQRCRGRGLYRAIRAGSRRHDADRDHCRLPLIPLVVSRKALVALVPIAVLSLIHIRGLGPGRVVQNVLAGLKASALALIIALGFMIGSGASGGCRPRPRRLSRSPGMLLALVPIMFTYSGWNAAVYVAEEVRDPGRNVPLALGLGTATVIVIYVAFNALVPARARRRRARCATGSAPRRRRRAAIRRGGGECDRHLHDRQPEREHQRDDAGRSARVLRDGEGRAVPLLGCACASPIPHAGGRDRRAVDLERPCWCCADRCRSS